MTNDVGLAGVIGIRVADFLALIALFGVVALFLLRRARSERQVALGSIDDSHYEFIHPGLKVPCLMLFALDYEKVFGESALPIHTFLTFKTALFAALHACVRSKVFYSSFDSMDLLRSIERMDDLVYVSALSSKWRHQSLHLKARNSVIPKESLSD